MNTPTKWDKLDWHVPVYVDEGVDIDIGVDEGVRVCVDVGVGVYSGVRVGAVEGVSVDEGKNVYRCSFICRYI